MASSSLSDFVQTGARTLLFTPPKPISGQLVILCTWLGAARKHIFKYTTLYREIAPGARILVIESHVPIIISSYVKQREAIKPAVAVVLDTLATECGFVAGKGSRLHSDSTTGTNKPAAQILLHVFSNGGTTIATQLLLVLNARLEAPLPLVGLLCDSCPAKGTYWRSYNAMVLSLPKDLPTRILGALACHCILVMLYTWIAWGNENPATLHRRTLLDGETVSLSREESVGELGGDKKVGGRVCYFYSKEDQMCLWTDINHHADDARRLGWDVREIVFEGSGHCAHFPMYEARYSDAVKSVWNGEGSWQVNRKTSKL